MTQKYPIRMIRLVTGETIIAGIASAGENSYVLEHPMMMIVMPLKQTSVTDYDMKEDVGIMLKEWIDFSEDKTFIIPKTAVICTTMPNRMLISDYAQAKIGNTIVKDMSSMTGFPETMSVAEFEDESEDEEDDEDYYQDPPTEFPGWGGDPRL